MAEDIEIESNKTPTTADGKPNIKFWLGQIEAYDRMAKPYLRDGQRAWDEYTAHAHRVTSTKDLNAPAATRYPLYWSCTRVIRPALYSRTPIPVAKKAFDSMKAPAARLAAILAERRANYLIRACPFDRVMYATRDDFIHTGRGTFRVCFELEGYQNEELGEIQDEQQQEGAPLPDLDDIRCYLMPVHFRDIRHTPNARHQDEIEWMSHDSWMTREDVEARFGKDVADKLTYSPFADYRKDKEERDQAAGIPQTGATITEIWDKRTKRVLWVDKNFKDDFLDTKDDPYQLAGFFPFAPFILGTTGPDHLLAVPDYVQLEPMFEQLHGALDRFRRVLRASRTVGIYDGAAPELKDALEGSPDGDFVAIEKFKELLGEGDMERLIKFFPTEKLMQAATFLMQAIEAFEQKVYELWGIPDILRGISDPQETAAAQQQKGKFIAGMFSATQREFQRIVRDGIEMLVDLASTKFPVAKRMEIDGFQFMDQQEQQIWQMADAILADDSQRLIELDIETDSTITMNENADIEQANYLAKTVLDGLAALAAQPDPILKMIALETSILTIQKLRNGKQIEEKLEPLRQQLMQQIQNPPQQPPDPAMIKAQTDMQIAQAKQQTEMAKAQSDERMQMAEMQFKLQTMMQELNFKREELAMEQERLKVETISDAVKTRLEQKIASFEAQIRASELQIEQYKVVLDEKEKLLEEERLRHEHGMELVRMAHEKDMAREQSKAAEASKPKEETKKPTKRVIKVKRDEKGNAVQYEASDS